MFLESMYLYKQISAILTQHVPKELCTSTGSYHQSATLEFDTIENFRKVSFLINADSLHMLPSSV